MPHITLVTTNKSILHMLKANWHKEVFYDYSTIGKGNP
ncbi:hypothetical protein MIZ03_4387 [Rhodoferax lithotrophicus]|uniref:Uncharacterized protein n=1 Tax=Rhodoferax lithotrophicus TaxID=2798804 RepID=A0ABM7MM04_9BURK|nr:hypothetical protein MIZ03_2196 [Rhodoferax sp. MIZ03]BCO29464.1 hypothetical protein MIZ03_4387 [Rhodoferax sp. MIZ03]